MTTFGAVNTSQSLTRSIILTVDDFRKGVTAPTDATIGTTPTIPALLFNATNELLSAHVIMPQNWDHSVDASFDMVWSLAANQTNNDVLSTTVDYTVPIKLSTGDGVAKTSTQLTPTVTVTTANGLATGDIYVVSGTLASADAINPFSAAAALGFCLEFHMTNTTGVASAHFIAACINFTGTR